MPIPAGKRTAVDAPASPAEIKATGKTSSKRSKSQSGSSPGPKKPGRKPSSSEPPAKKSRVEERVSWIAAGGAFALVCERFRLMFQNAGDGKTAEIESMPVSGFLLSLG